MDSFDGGRRRDPRAPLPPAERRPNRDGEPLEQRLDRWMSTGRQLVEGVSGGRPGTRQGGRRPEGRAGQRGGFDGLGRWVEDRLDWLLDDSDDWPEPWQQSERRRAEPPAPMDPGLWREPEQASERSPRSRRPLQAISRRGGVQPDGADWPDDEAFSVPRWQRPSAPLRRPDPLQTELERRGPETVDGAETRPGAGARPLPRSSRRR